MPLIAALCALISLYASAAATAPAVTPAVAPDRDVSEQVAAAARAALAQAADEAIAAQLAALVAPAAAHTNTAPVALDPAAPALAASPATPAPDDLFEHFGFDGFIISKFNNGISDLRAADVDGDGLGDMILVNNSKAQIEVLRQRRPDEEIETHVPESINDLADETYFIRSSYPTEQKVTSLVIADLDSDGDNDLAFLGDSNRVTIAWRNAEGHWGDEVRFDVDDPATTSKALRAGDIDGDGDLDLVVLGKTTTQLFLQDGGALEAGPKLPNATSEPDALDLLDIDGDGRLDLMYLSGGSDSPFRYRLGEGGGAFGPERRSLFTSIRTYASADLDGDGKAEVGAVRRRSGRFALLRYQEEAAGNDELALSSLMVLPFASFEGSGKREVVLSQLDGDGRTDLLLAEPKASRLVSWRGNAAGRFQESTVHPSLVGASSPHVSDVDGDGLPEVVVAAPDEGGIGIADVDASGRIGFPRALPVPGEDLLALTVADSDGDGASEIWVVTGEGKSRSRKHTLARLDAAGGAPQTWPLDDPDADPSSLLVADLDRDGRGDVIAFVSSKMPKVLLARGDEWLDVPVDDVPGLGILKGLSRAQVSYGDVDGDGSPELLVPGPNFARAFVLAAGGSGDTMTVEVVGQYNLDDPSASVAAVALAALSGGARAEVLLVDSTSDELHVLAPADDGSARTVAVVELGGLSPSTILVADLDADGLLDIALPAGDELGMVVQGGTRARFVPEHEYELPVKSPNLDRIAFGDVNGDGNSDLVLTETNKHLIAIATMRDGEIAHAMKFPVFEQRLFSRGGGSREPRELIIAELTGDGLLDIAIIVHDRVIVYPQD